MPGLPENGMVHLASSYPVDELIARLKTQLSQRGLSLFAHIDHAQAAEDVGLHMQPAVLLLFGNAKSGTPLMVACPTVAIDLPLKALAWQDAQGKTWLSYNTPAYLQQRHGIPEELLKNISGMQGILEQAVEQTQPSPTPVDASPSGR